MSSKISNLFIVDAFANEPFRGNPAVVVLLSEAPREAWMQQVAMEMNLSETAFLFPVGRNEFSLRWFTPRVEVDLCGHATLASAHVLWATEQVDIGDTILFHTRSGVLPVSKRGDNIYLDFPALPVVQVAPGEQLLACLGTTPVFVGKWQSDFLVHLPDERNVVAFTPDFHMLGKLDARIIMITAKSARDEYDFVSRVFAPRVGIDEDPVTGSAHCCLAPYWQQQLHKDNLVAYQASARGGYLTLDVRGARVLIGGKAAIFAEGRLYV